MALLCSETSRVQGPRLQTLATGGYLLDHPFNEWQKIRFKRTMSQALTRAAEIRSTICRLARWQNRPPPLSRHIWPFSSRVVSSSFFLLTWCAADGARGQQSSRQQNRKKAMQVVIR